MKLTLSPLLMLLCLALAGMPAAARADGGYLPLAVPDLPQAVGFFHEVLNCAVLSERAGRGAAAAAPW